MQESTQPEGVETPTAEIPRGKAIMTIGETSTLREEEATAEVREISDLQEEATTEVGETSALQDSPKDSTSLGPQQGKEVLMSQMFLFTSL